MSITLDNQESQIILTEHATAPVTPPSGTSTLYIKTDGLPYVKDDAGTETALAGGGGGGGVVEPWGQIVFGTGTGASSSTDLVYDPDNGQLEVNSNAAAITYPGNVTIKGRSTSRNHSLAYGGGVFAWAGDSTVGSGYGGSVELFAGDAVIGDTGGYGGQVDIAAGNGQYGGNLNVFSGDGSGFGNGGTLTIMSGIGTDFAAGGQLALIAGSGAWSGDATLKCDPVPGTSGRGGFTHVIAGNTTSADRGGIASLEGGDTTTNTAYKRGGRFYVTSGGETLTGTPYSTASATVAEVKEHIQTNDGGFGLDGSGFPDASLARCARKFVVQAITSGSVVHTLPVQIPNSAMWTIRAQIAVSALTSSNNFAGYEVTGVLAEFGGTVTLYSPVTTTLHATAGASGWSLAVTADNTNKTLVFTINTDATQTARTITVDVSQAR